MNRATQGAERYRDVAIIGAGFSGVAVSYNLLSELCKTPTDDRSLLFRIRLFEPSGEVGSGLAYGTHCHEHLLNVPASGMSISSAIPDDFVAWLTANHPEYRASDFVPRRLYRSYLQERLAGIRRQAADRAILEVVPHSVIHLQRFADSDYELKDEVGHTFLAQAVVIALGNVPFPPSFLNPSHRACTNEGRLNVVHGHYLGHEAFGDMEANRGDESTLASPWRETDLCRAAKASTVGIIGSSLTAIDTVLALEGRGYTGRYTLISRHGRLPHAHAPRRSSGDGAVSDWVARIVASHTLHAMVREYFAAARANTCWRTLIDTLRPSIQTLWMRLTLVERRRFLRHLRGRWDPVRHRIPEASATIIARLQDEGRLRVMAASVREVGISRPTRGDEGMGEPHKDCQVFVSLRSRRNQQSEELSFDVVFNCTGLIPDIRISDSVLLSQVVGDGLAVYDDLYLGLRTGPLGEILMRNGSTAGSCYTLGPLRRGELWETTAVREIREQAATISQQLVLA